MAAALAQVEIGLNDDLLGHLGRQLEKAHRLTAEIELCAQPFAELDDLAVPDTYFDRLIARIEVTIEEQAVPVA